jgi:L-asparaginase
MTSPFNFGAASERDSVVFGCCEPGFKHPIVGMPRTPREGPTKADEVEKWATFMKKMDITRIIPLLTPEEYSFFETSLLSSYRRHFQFVHKISPYTEGSMQAIMKALIDAERAGEKIVVHCATGQGRTADVLALWLHRRYDLSVEDSVSEIASYAKSNRMLRRPTSKGLLKLLAPSLAALGGPAGTPRTASGALTARSAYGNATPRGAPEPSQKGSLHITLLQMGGTIDKVFPVGETAGARIHGGGALPVISEPAALRLLAVLPCGFSYDVVSVCRRAGPVTKADRERLLRMCRIAEANKLLITHGETDVVETAQFLRAHALREKGSPLSEKTMILTGAFTPEVNKDSDACFNIGVAVGALNVLRRGVFVCMNGRVFEASRVRRDPSTGFFVPSGKHISASDSSKRPKPPPNPTPPAGPSSASSKDGRYSRLRGAPAVPRPRG